MYTAIIIFLMAAGIVLGFAFFSKSDSTKPLRFIGFVQQGATCLLLCLMGIWLGGNKSFWADISRIGMKGALFAAVTITASVFSVHIVSKLFFKKKAEQEDGGE